MRSTLAGPWTVPLVWLPPDLDALGLLMLIKTPEAELSEHGESETIWKQGEAMLNHQEESDINVTLTGRTSFT